MIRCQACGGKCRCVDSREKLAYGIRPDDRTPGTLRERKYICPECGEVHITSETVSMRYSSDSKDKRLLDGEEAENA